MAQIASLRRRGTGLQRGDCAVSIAPFAGGTAVFSWPFFRARRESFGLFELFRLLDGTFLLHRRRNGNASDHRDADRENGDEDFSRNLAVRFS
jgi:hypothetical protein